MATENLTIVYPKGAMEVRGGTPIAQDGTVANNANAYGVLEGDIKWPETTGAVIVSGEVNYDWACSNSGIGIVKKAADAMSGITFVQDDGEPYVFPCSGGGSVTDPILENAKETGGIGYTEGDATTITWDGDTSGLISPNNLDYKVSDATPSVEQLIGGTLVNSLGEVLRISEGNVFDMSTYGLIIIADESGEFSDEVSIMYDAPKQLGEVYYEENGIYFPHHTYDGDDYVSSLTYTTETIHKIDPKYLDIDSLKTALGLSLS